MGKEKFVISDNIDNNLLLERFLVDCHDTLDDNPEKSLAIASLADNIAMIFYYRDYSTIEEFIEDNAEYLDSDRKEWVVSNWHYLAKSSEEERAEMIIDSINQLSELAREERI